MVRRQGSPGDSRSGRLYLDAKPGRLLFFFVPALAAFSGATNAASVVPAFQNASAACKDTVMTDPAFTGRATIIRSGSGHSATIVRRSDDGTILLEQHGRDHAAVSVQSGSGDSLVIRQSGAQASADVSQDGPCNSTEIDQSGQGNRAVTTQSGSNNRVVIRQSAPHREGEAQ